MAAEEEGRCKASGPIMVNTVDQTHSKVYSGRERCGWQKRESADGQWGELEHFGPADA